MKKKRLITFLSVALMMNLFQSPQVHAGLGMGWWIEPHSIVGLRGVRNLLLCYMFIPICILDQKVDGVPSIGRQDLIDNGISVEQADRFVKFSSDLAEELRHSGQRLTVLPGDTKISLEQEIYSILPNLPNDFVQFYIEQILS